jgi:hypothetical protein
MKVFITNTSLQKFGLLKFSSEIEGLPRRGEKACGVQPAKAFLPPGWRRKNLNISFDVQIR